MNIYRLLSVQALQAGILGGGTTVDTVTNVSPALYPAITPVSNFVLANTYTAPQVFANTSGIAPTSGTNTQTGLLNRNAGNAWSTLVATVSSGPVPGLLLTSQYGDYLTLVPPPTIGMVQINLTGMVQPGMGFHSGDPADGSHPLSSGQARNGVHVAVTLDTQAPQIYDTANQNLLVTVFLDGVNQHAIRIAHTGFYDAALPIIRTPVAAFTSSLYNKMTAFGSTTQGQGAAAGTIAALWTFRATGAATYTLTRTLPGGSPTTVGGTFSTGTTYDATGTVPGVAFLVNGPLVTGDTGSFITDAGMAIVDSVSFYTGTGGASGSYTTPIFDSGNPATQWFLYEHVDALFANGASTIAVTALTGGSLATVPIGSYTPPPGQMAAPTRVAESYLINANPDPTTNGGANTYSTITGGFTTGLTLTGIQLPSSGDHVIDAGLMGTPVGQYAQFTIQLAANTQGSEAWARQFAVYSWVPTAAGNPIFIGKMGLPPNWTPGPLLQGYYGSLLSFAADDYAGITDYVASFGVSTATGTLLLAKGADLGELHVLGEPSSAYQTRLSTSLQAKSLGDAPTGIVTTGIGTPATPLVTPAAGSISVSPVAGEQGSLYFICQQGAQLVNGVTPTLTATVASATGFASVSGGGLTVNQVAGRGITITLPNPPYAGLPGLAYGTTGGVDNPAKALLKQYFQSLMPAGTLFNPNSSTYLNFGPLG